MAGTERQGGFVAARGGDNVGLDAEDAPAARSALGLGGVTFVGLDRRQTAQALMRYAGHAVRRPGVVAASSVGFAAEELRIVTGNSSLAPDPKDRRFADRAWQGRGWRQLVQSYLALRDAVYDSIDQLDLDEGSKERARFGLMQITEAVAPSNNLLTNPVAIRRALKTRGTSLVDGARHLAWDVRNNGGLPSQVDTRPFRVGENDRGHPRIGGAAHRSVRADPVRTVDRRRCAAVRS